MTKRRYRSGSVPRSTELASAILDNAERDVVFMLRIRGQSLDLLSRHFREFIERSLESNGVGYGDHPLLRLFVETHGRELTDFVVSGMALSHQTDLKVFEQFGGDSTHLLRADVWDSLRGYIESAEQHFLSGLGGLHDILAEIDAHRPDAAGGVDD
ncbi:hypothetical protein KHC28_03405 [Ancylobacter sonchi]|uniref:hypothetical protein n=1 Tax=Ancylobacter sonchi TaxID=1937790 RepID=UPI001BD41308|nr:hypothetical protein [Ancylobacter sonchi]MBS7532698.1 hypothetical protein [Ancylobacter sonchi]